MFEDSYPHVGSSYSLSFDVRSTTKSRLGFQTEPVSNILQPYDLQGVDPFFRETADYTSSCCRKSCHKNNKGEQTCKTVCSSDCWQQKCDKDEGEWVPRFWVSPAGCRLYSALSAVCLQVNFTDGVDDLDQVQSEHGCVWQEGYFSGQWRRPLVYSRVPYGKVHSFQTWPPSVTVRSSADPLMVASKVTKGTLHFGSTKQELVWVAAIWMNLALAAFFLPCFYVCCNAWSQETTVLENKFNRLNNHVHSTHIQQQRKVAFLMGMHPRLGNKSSVNQMAHYYLYDSNLINLVFDFVGEDQERATEDVCLMFHDLDYRSTEIATSQPSSVTPAVKVAKSVTKSYFQWRSASSLELGNFIQTLNCFNFILSGLTAVRVWPRCPWHFLRVPKPML